jgi:hypothetical protein
MTNLSENSELEGDLVAESSGRLPEATMCSGAKAATAASMSIVSRSESDAIASFSTSSAVAGAVTEADVD